MNNAKCFNITIDVDEKRFSEIMAEATAKICGECFSFGEPVNEEEYSDEYDPHTVAEAMCWKCGKRWIAAFPSETLLKELECPGCGEVGHAFLTGQDVVQDD